MKKKALTTASNGTAFTITELLVVIFIISAAFFALARILNKKSKELKIVEKSDSDKTIA